MSAARDPLGRTIVGTDAHGRTILDTEGARNDYRRVEYHRKVHAACVRVLLGEGLDAAAAWWVAVALVSHWARETGHGRAMYAYNVGNMRAANWGGAVVLLQGGDDAAPSPYRAYDSLDDGVRDTLRLLHARRYAAAWAALVASDGRGPYTITYGAQTASLRVDAAGWYRAIMIAGWHPYSDAVLREYGGVVLMVLRSVGTPPAAPALAVAGAVAAVAGATLALVAHLGG